MTDPLRRHFNPRGPNYPPSGLDTPGRDAERKWVEDAEVMETAVNFLANQPYLKWWFVPFGNEQGAVSLGGSASCSPTQP